MVVVHSGRIIMEPKHGGFGRWFSFSIGWFLSAPGTPSVLFLLGHFTPKTSNYYLKNMALGFPGMSIFRVVLSFAVSFHLAEQGVFPAESWMCFPMFFLIFGGIFVGTLFNPPNHWPTQTIGLICLCLSRLCLMLNLEPKMTLVLIGVWALF